MLRGCVPTNIHLANSLRSLFTSNSLNSVCRRTVARLVAHARTRRDTPQIVPLFLRHNCTKTLYFRPGLQISRMNGIPSGEKSLRSVDKLGKRGGNVVNNKLIRCLSHVAGRLFVARGSRLTDCVAPIPASIFHVRSSFSCIDTFWGTFWC